ncbi:MAG TPA: hypothetical protein VFV99_17075 [Kofleriaceae bacterium]|nr:hypothetical protein [Kofleriaceae bacterium]
MRAVSLLVLVAVPAWARADVSVGASVGAGAQGAATYGALDLRLDAAWPNIRLGIGARGVWDDAEFRRSDWNGVGSVLTLVRDFEATRDVGDTRFSVAAGALAPAHITHVVNGYRAALDDRFHTGIRAAAEQTDLDAVLEVDDVLDPALIAGGLRFAMAPPYAMHLGIAIDPSAPAMDGTHTITAIEAGASSRFEGFRARADVGVSVVAEISLGAGVVAFANGAAERGGVLWTARADAQAGTGTAGSLFGPLYRIERLAHDGRASEWDRAHAGDLNGASVGFAVGAGIPTGWLELGARARPGLGGLVFASGGAPMGRYVQAGMWAAAGRDDAAGAGELRVAWAKRMFSALQVARMYRLDPMEPISLWSVTAWFGATSQ